MVRLSIISHQTQSTLQTTHTDFVPSGDLHGQLEDLLLVFYKVILNIPRHLSQADPFELT